MNSYLWVPFADLVHVFVFVGLPVQVVKVFIHLDSDLIRNPHNDFPRRDVLQYEAPLFDFFHRSVGGRGVTTPLCLGFEHWTLSS